MEYQLMKEGNKGEPIQGKQEENEDKARKEGDKKRWLVIMKEAREEHQRDKGDGVRNA